MRNIVPQNIYIFLLSFLMAPISMVAQKDSSKLEFNQVEVIKAFEVTLKEASRLNVDPVLENTDAEPIKYRYTISPAPVTIGYPDPEIRALAIQPDDLSPGNQGFLKGGYGMRRSPFFEGGYHNVRKDIYDWGVYGKFFSVDDQEKTLNHKMTDIDLALQGNYVWKNNVQLSGKFENDFKNRTLWNENESPDSISTTRNINNVNLQFGLGNIDLSKYKLNYSTSAGLTSTRVSDQNVFEQSLFVEGQVEKHRTEKLGFFINAKLEAILLKSEDWHALYNIHTSPYFMFTFGKFKGLVGASALISSHKSAIFPKIDLSYVVYKNHVQVFAGTDQKVFSNTIHNLSTINPFMNTRLQTLNNSISKEMFAGLKGEYSFLSYQFSFGLKDVKNMAFFTYDSLDAARLPIEYDDAKIVFFSGNLDFRITKTTSVGGWLTQNIINTDTLLRPWHTPQFLTNFYISSQFFEKKLKCSAFLTFIDKYKFYNSTGDIQNSKVLFDLELKAEYFPWHNFGVYVRGTNLLNSDFQRWYGYRNIPLQVSGGIMFTF